jgi:hypothetical protein
MLIYHEWASHQKKLKRIKVASPLRRKVAPRQILNRSLQLDQLIRLKNVV